MAFKKGQSGNPGGRAKGYTEVVKLARKHTPEALKVILGLMRGAEKEETRLKAAQEIIDRGHGKSAAFVVIDGDLDVTNHVDVEDMTDEQLAVIVARGIVEAAKAKPVKKTKTRRKK